MRVIRAFLPVKVYRRIPRIIWRRLILIASLLETLKAGRRFKQRPIDCEMLIAEQPVFFRLVKHLFEESLGNVSLQKPLSVLAEGCRIPNVVVHTQPNEPPEQHVVVELFHQQSFTSHAVKYLKQQSAEQLLGRDRRPPGLRIKLLELRRQLYKYLVHHFADRTKGMILRHPLLGRDVAKHSILMKIVSAHFFRLRRWIEGLLQSTLQSATGYCYLSNTGVSFSAAC